MASWITIAAIVSTFAAFRLPIAAFAIFCFSVAFILFAIEILSGSDISHAVAWTLLLIGAMQVGYFLGVLILSLFLYLASRYEARNRQKSSDRQ
jgi:hypothetical protein